MTETTEIKIRDRAYALWQQNGCAEGRDWDFWLQAEREILGDAAAGCQGGQTARRQAEDPRRAEGGGQAQGSGQIQGLSPSPSGAGLRRKRRER